MRGERETRNWFAREANENGQRKRRGARVFIFLFFFLRAHKNRRYDASFCRTRPRQPGRMGGGMVLGIQDTALTMRARGVSTLRTEAEGGEGTHSVHLRCILRKSRTCQAIRISFFIPRGPSPSLIPAPAVPSCRHATLY